MLAIMKRLVAVPVVLFAMLTLGACSSSTPAISEDDYLDMVSELESFDGVTDELFVELGEGVCEVRVAADEDGIEQQDGLVVLLKEYTDGGFDAKDTGAFFTYATARYCPQYIDEGIGG